MIYFKESSNNKQAFLSIEQLKGKTDAALRRGLMRVGQSLRKSAQDGIKNPPKTGKRYKSLRRRSSTANQYPANQTGNLRKSIGFKVESPRRLRFGSRIKYARYLELGTRKMGKRLLIRFTVNKNQNNIFNTLRNSLEAELT